MTWFISIPIWGDDHYARVFARATAPALMAAVSRFDEPVKFVVHTDLNKRELIQAALPGQAIEFHTVPRNTTYVVLQQSHAAVVQSAAVGDRVMLLNADLVVSGNLLVRCAEHFAEGKLVVVLMGVRTTWGPATPVGAEPRELLEWAWEHRHQIIRDLEWPTGGSMLPTHLFWPGGHSVVARGFHQHPVALVKQENTTFKSTIDNDLLDAFPMDCIHMVTDPDDCAMFEISPAGRRFPVRHGNMTPQTVAASMNSRASPMHRWLFTHRVIIVGDGKEDQRDVLIAEQILNNMRHSSMRGRPQRGRPTGRRGRIPAGRRGRVPHA